LNSQVPATRSFFQASVLMFVCSNAAIFFQFIFQSLMKRELPPGDFSLMNSLFSMAAVLSMPVSFLGSIWVRKLAELRARGRVGLAFHYLKMTTLYSLVYAAIACAILYSQMNLLKGFLNTDNQFAVSSFIMGLFLGLGMSMMGGFLQGMQAFGIIALTSFVGPLFRLLLGYSFLKVNWGAASGVWATAIQGAIPFVAGLWYLVHHGLYKEPYHPEKEKGHWKPGDVWMPAVSIVIAIVLINSDFILVQHFFPKAQADQFATAALFGHTMIFVLMPIAAVVLPKVVDHFEGWEQAEKSVARKSLALSLGLALLMALAGTLLAAFVLKIFAGKTDPETLTLVRWFLWAIIPTALAFICLNALLARLQGGLILLCLAISLLLPAMIAWNHAKLADVLVAHCTVGTLLLSVMVFGNLHRLKK